MFVIYLQFRSGAFCISTISTLNSFLFVRRADSQPPKLCLNFLPSVSEEILLLRSPRAPCSYAARANSEGAKFRFASVVFIALTELSPDSSILPSPPVDPISPPASKHTTQFRLCYPFVYRPFWSVNRRVYVYMVEVSASKPSPERVQ